MARDSVWEVMSLGVLFTTPWTKARQAPLSRGFSRRGYWSGLPCPPPGNLPDPGIEPRCPNSPALQTDYLPLAGYLKSFRGVGGGYQIAKDPKEYRIGDILRAAETSLAPTACITGSQSCDRCDECLTRPFWLGLDQAIAHYVDSVTLADLLKQNNL